MNITHIEHVGLAVKNLKESIRYYEDILGLKCYAVEEIDDQKVKTAFFQIGQTKIELLETTDSNGPIGKFIEKNGEGIHHIAFAVKNLKESLQELSSKNIQLVDNEPRIGAEHFEIAFLHPKSTFGTLTELCEKPEVK